MPQIDPAKRNAVMAALDAGVPQKEVAAMYKVKPGTVRQWAKRRRDTGGDTVVELVTPTPVSTLDPIERLRQDIADTRRRLALCEKLKVMTAIPAMMRQVRAMEQELEQRLADKPTPKEDSDEDRVAVIVAHCRVLRWSRKVVEDRQARTMLERALRERTD